MEKILLKISGLIETYEQGPYLTIEKLHIMLKELTSNYYFLTKHNIEAFNNHNAVQYKHKGSVSAGIILANEQFPELRETRKILYATDRVINSMRSEISTLRKDQ